MSHTTVDNSSAVVPAILHRTPAGTGWDGWPAGHTIAEAVGLVLGVLWQNPRLRSSEVFDRVPAGGYGMATLFAVRTGRVLVIGNSPMADAVRQVVAEPNHVGEWQLHALPETCTPLIALRPYVDTRTYNLLARSGFSTIEEISVVPAESWLDLRSAGPRFVDQLRLALEVLGVDTSALTG